jgi:hypothetical protein
MAAMSDSNDPAGDMISMVCMCSIFDAKVSIKQKVVAEPG